MAQLTFRPITTHDNSAGTAHPTVLHVRVVAGSGGGPDKTILRSAAYARDADLNMAAVYIHPHGDDGINTLRRHAEAFESPFIGVPESGPIDPQTIARLLRICRQQRVALWHAHDYKSNLIGLLLRPLHPMKLVTTAHGWTWDTPRTRLYYRVDNLCIPRYEQVIAVSPQIRDHIASLGVPDDRLHYVPNGIEPDEYQRRFTRDAACRAIGFDIDAFHIGVVGRLSVEKGADRALTAVRDLAVRHANRNVQLHLVGDGPQREALEAQARDAGIAGRVHFHGWQTDTRTFYEAFDGLLLPSHTEGLPNVVLEAMAMGVPVAATNVGGVADLLDHGRCGVILGDDPQGWASAIRQFVASASYREELTAAARSRIETKYAFSHRMQRVFDVYDRLLGRERSTTQEPLRRAA